ncbi:MAG: primosomal protein N' [Zetaproteobacteria bacterium]|nr:primosomal protein N' [Zetaproteobacteria bacterium]
MGEYLAACYVDVAVFAPLADLYTYRWDDALGVAEIGLRVMVPFGQNSWRMAVVMHLHHEAPASAEQCKVVEDRCDLAPLFDLSRQRWLQRAKQYYLATMGEMQECALAWAANDEKRRFRCMDVAKLPDRYRIWATIFDSKRALSLKAIRQRNLHLDGDERIAALQYQLLQLLALGVVEEVVTCKTVALAKMAGEAAPAQLFPEQDSAIETLAASQHQFAPFLLFGATGSGKTEVYLQAAAKLIEAGKQVMVLVPEIGLTPMWLGRLAARFDRVVAWHSGLRDADRIAVRKQLQDAEILIGTRSALFLPLPRLGMIVIDEEHDGSFKQQDGVAYSARDMSLLLAQELKIPIVLGSATPSLELWRLVQLGQLQRLDLSARIQFSQGNLADSTVRSVAIEVVDMRMQPRGATLSAPLVAALKETLARQQQSILFLNRRGYSPALQCSACGDVPQCHACALRLTLHRSDRQLRCHACGYSRFVPRMCESCGEDALLPMGVGTEKLEELLGELLPDLRFARLDRDTVVSPAMFQQTLQDFEQGLIDCLIGTQMLVKGHHFPKVTLVGVINADLGLSLPDFRAGERWWQQMTQVMGRAGRGALQGSIVIQTQMPDAMWLQKLGRVSTAMILSEELSMREALSFPPYARWVRVVFSSHHLDKAHKAAVDFAKALQSIEGLQVSGAMPCPLERLAGRFRFEVIVRDPSRQLLPWKLSGLLQSMRVPSQVRRKVDVDPVEFM